MTTRAWGVLVVGVALLGCGASPAPKHGAPATASASASAAVPTPQRVMLDAKTAPFAPPCREPWDEPLPQGAIARLGSSRIRFGSFEHVAFLPDGERLVSGGAYGDVHLWDARTARITRWIGSPERDGHDFEGLVGLGVSRGGHLAVAASYEGLLIYDLDAGKLRDTVPIVGQRVTNLELASEADVGIYGRCIHNGDTVGTFDTKTGELLTTYPAHQAKDGESCSQEVAISPDGTLLAADADREVVLIERQSGALRGRLRVGGVAVQSLAFSSDGRRLVVATTDRALNVFDVDTQRAVRSFGWVASTASTNWPEGASLSPGGRWLVAEARGAVQVWDYDRQVLSALYGRAVGNDGAPVWSPDGTLLAYPSRHPDTVVVMDVAMGKRLGVADLCRHDSGLKSILFSDDGARIVTVAGETARLWEATRGIALGRIEHAVGVAFSRDGERVAVSGWECGLRLHRVSDGALLHGKELTEEDWHNRMCLPLGLTRSPSADVVALTDNRGMLRVLRLEDGSEIARHDLSTSLENGVELSAPAWSPDGTRIAVGHSRGVTVLDPQGKKVASFAYDERVYDVAFSPDGMLLATHHHSHVRILDARRGSELHHFALNRWQQLAFLSSDRLVLGRESGVVADLDGETVTTFDASGSVRIVAASRDGERLASSGDDGVALVWRRP